MTGLPEGRDDRVVPPPSGRGAGWVVFSGILLVLVGGFEVAEGAVALFDESYARGWAHVAIGLVAALAGIGVLAGSTIARVAGAVLAAASTIAHAVFFAETPVWSTIVIVVDLFVIYTIVVHGRALKAESY